MLGARAEEDVKSLPSHRLECRPHSKGPDRGAVAASLKRIAKPQSSTV
jgi:hypothetical protein